MMNMSRKLAYNKKGNIQLHMLSIYPLNGCDTLLRL